MSGANVGTRQIRKGAAQAIEMNRDILKYVESVPKESFVDRRLDTIRLDALSHEGGDVLGDDALFGRLEEFRYELSGLNQDIDVHSHVAFGPLRAAFVIKGSTVPESYSELEPFIEGYRKQIVDLAGRLHKKAEALLGEIAAAPSYQKVVREKAKETSQ